MSVSVIKRPQGHILSSTGNLAGVTNSAGSASFNDTGHGLVDGDFIFVSSNVSDYNGFWYVDQTDVDNFLIKEYSSASAVAFVSLTEATYYKATSSHNWSAVHLPIIYKLSNTAWPTNSIDTARTESSTVDDNGYCKVTVSGGIKGSGIAENLDYVKVQTGALAGIYQIINLYSNTVFTLNIPYSAANDAALSGATLQYYYNNYTVRVKVWAGVNAWAGIKPMESIAEIDIVPDSDNIVNVNVSELIKEKIKVISNNTLLATLPHDIDSFTQFFIEYTETYDKSDYGDVMTTYIAPYTNDQSNFQGVAVNAKLPFKNRYSGYMSEYLLSSSASKFLTLFNVPRLFQGCYYDISFLKQYDDSYVKMEYYDGNDNLSFTETEYLPDYGVGVYRKEILFPSSSIEKSVNITVHSNVINQILTNNDFDTNIDDWSNAGVGTDWIDGITITTSPVDTGSSKRLEQTFATKAAGQYRCEINAFNTGAGLTVMNHIVEVYNGSTLVQELLNFNQNITSYQDTGVIEITASFDRIAFRAAYVSGDTGKSAGVDYINFYEGAVVSETKTIILDSECSFQSIYLTWKNYLGGMDYWKFTAQKDYITDIEETTETTENIFPSWPNSYGEFSDTIDKETSRTSRNKIVVRSQNMTEDEMNAVRYIVSSPLVQIMVSRSDRRTVKVSKGSFTWKRDEDKLYSIEFEISYTDTIPGQSL